MEENKKSGGGDVRASPFRGTASGIKPENSFSALSPLTPTVGCCARHSHPSPPEKKAASRKKSRLRRKKTAPDAKMAHRVYQGGMSLPVVDCHNRPTRGSSLWLRRAPSCASGFAFACMELLTILACVVKHAVQRSLYGRLFCTNTRSPCHSR